ncbi:MAG: LysE family transporter [Cyclobacteriaceae bacterium]|nr:LysE family transporter [Cyclobacteriaceae bacterium]
MIDALFSGLQFGMVLAFLIGPVFFTILQASVERGFWVGVLVALGVSFSDFLYVLICYFGLSGFVTRPGISLYMGLVGGVILLLFGAYHLFVKSRRRDFSNPGAVRASRPIKYLAKGFLINTMSPMVPLFWIGAVSLATLDLGYHEGSEISFFFAGVLGMALATDIGKAYLAGRLRELITHRLLVIMNIIVGTVLIVFGARLILTAVQAA